MKKPFSIITLMFFCAIQQISAQSGVVAAGNSATGSGGSFSYSIGQVDYQVIGNSNAGIQQVYLLKALPVTWLNFSATKQGSIVLLKWEVEKEINCDKYIVERSVNGIDFTGLGSKKAIGNTTSNTKYSLDDKNPNAGNNYYRVKQVDFDGKFTYSAVAVVNFEKNLSITCYPNPVKSQLIISVNNANTTAYTYQLFDLNGRLLKSERITGRITSISMAALKPASYLLKIMEGSTLTTSFIVIKD